MNELVKIIDNSQLEISESKSILEKFGDYENIAKEWEVKAKQIVVTDASQTTEMAMAKEARKKFSQLRIDVEKTRKAMKEQSLRKGQAIDSVARFLTSLIKPIEDHLREQEDFIKIQEEKKQAELKRLEEEKQEKLRIEEEKRVMEEQKRIREENEKLKEEMKKKEVEIVKIKQNAQKVVEKEVKKKVQEVLKNKLVICPRCDYEFEVNNDK